MSAENWITGALSSIVSIGVSAFVSEWRQRRGDRRNTVRRIMHDLRVNLGLIDSWLDALGTPLDSGLGPVVPPMRSLSELGAATAVLRPDMVDRLRYLEMVIGKLPEQSSHTDLLIERLSHPGAVRSPGDIDRLLDQRRKFVVAVRAQIEKALTDLRAEYE